MGLRERKRAQTRHRLEEAAVGLALRDGLDKVTIDAISERADVSPRTFFNYFDSKEDAILGVRPPDVTDDVLTAHRARYDGSELIESVIGLLITVMGPFIADSAGARRQQGFGEHIRHLRAGRAVLLGKLPDGGGELLGDPGHPGHQAVQQVRVLPDHLHPGLPKGGISDRRTQHGDQQPDQ